MLNNFVYYLYDDYLNCYSTFLMTNKSLRDNILNHRMNFLINYYISNNKNNHLSRHKLINLYSSSYYADYKKKYYNYHNNDKNDKNDKNDNYYEEKRDDDVEEHYKNIIKVPDNKKQPDYDKLDEEYSIKIKREEYEKKRDKEIIEEYQNEYKEQYENEYDYDYDYNDVDYDDDDNYEINNEFEYL